MHHFVIGKQYHLSGSLFYTEALNKNNNIFTYKGRDGFDNHIFEGVKTKFIQYARDAFIDAGYTNITPQTTEVVKEKKHRKRIKGAKITPRTVNKAVIKYKNGERYTLKGFDTVSLRSELVTFTTYTSKESVGYWTETQLSVHDIEHVDVRGMEQEFLLEFKQMHDETQIIAEGLNITTTEFTMNV